jgi:hypothetical protein
MPTLLLIDKQTNGPAAGEPFSIPENVTAHPVTDREGALRVLRADLQNTADPHWAGQIVIAFLQGNNEIEMPNGNDAVFRVEYKP